MNYLYTINLYKNDNKIHSEQLLSVNNYKTLNALLVGEDDIVPNEYVVDNGKMLMAVIDMILMEKYCEEEPQTINVTNSQGNEVLSDLFTTTDCVDEITGDVKEGFKLTVKVEEDE
nr:MAG TPA: hypothetical protein [Bacteriophage sp.]